MYALENKENQLVLFFYLFYFYLKKLFSLKNIFLCLGVLIIFIPIYFMFVSLFVDVLNISNDYELSLDKWMVFLIIFNIYFSFIINYLYFDLKKNEIQIEKNHYNSLIHIIIIITIWILFFLLVVFAFLETTNQFKFNEWNQIRGTWCNDFWIVILCFLYSFLLINIGSLFFNYKNYYIYLGIIFMLNCCSIFWILFIISSSTTIYYIFININISLLSFSIFLILLNVFKKFYLFKIKK